MLWLKSFQATNFRYHENTQLIRWKSRVYLAKTRSSYFRPIQFIHPVMAFASSFKNFVPQRSRKEIRRFHRLKTKPLGFFSLWVCRTWNDSCDVFMVRSVCRITGMLSSCSLVSFVRRTNVTRLHRIDYTEHTWHKSQCTVETRSNRDTGPALCISTELFLVSLFLVFLFLPLPFTFGRSILPNVGGWPELDEMEAQNGWKISSRFVSRLLVNSGLKLEVSNERISIVSFSGKFFVVFGLFDTRCKRVSRRNEETRWIHSRRVSSWCLEDLVDAEFGPKARNFNV